MSSTYTVQRLREQIGDLVDRHEEKRSLEEFRRYANDPVGFIREELKGEPWAKQEEIARAVLENRHVVVRAGNGLGKDWLAARLAMWWTYCRGGLALVTGPTERQVKEIVMGEVRRAFASAKTLPGDLYELALRLDRSEHAGILAFTSNNASMLTGFHAPALMVIVTEAQGVEPYVYEGAIANTTGEESRILAVGNPLSPTGRFYQINRSANWCAVPIRASEHPNVVEGREIIRGAVTQSFIDTIAEEYGAGSGVYAARVLGEFPQDSDEALVQRAWLERSAERWNTGKEEIREELAFALDPARYGVDKTCCVARRGRRLLELVTWSKASTMETVAKYSDFIAAYGATPVQPGQSAWSRMFNPDVYRHAALGANLVESHRPAPLRPPPPPRRPDILVDVVGLGGGIVDRMNELDWSVTAFNGGGAPEGADAGRFLNARAEAFWHLRKGLEEDRIDLPWDDLLVDELTTTRWATNSAGKIQVEPKKLVKAALGRSPDRADAVSMLFWKSTVRRTIDKSRYTVLKM
jgi:phage terminase large subunit